MYVQIWREAVAAMMIFQARSGQSSLRAADSASALGPADAHNHEESCASDVVWKGSTYGWCQDRAGSRRRSYASARGAIERKEDEQDDSAKKKKGKKEEEEVRRIDFPYCGPVRIRQQPWALNNTAHGYDGTTGVALWSGSFLMAHYIDQMLQSEEWKVDSDNANGLEINKRRSLVSLEIGAGLGLPSAMAAKCGMDVIATDYDDAVLPLLENNMKWNINEEELLGTNFPRPRVYRVDWSEASSMDPVFHDLQEGGRRGADVILLSDVIYGATRPLWKYLLALLNKLREQRLSLVLETGQDSFEGLARCDGTLSPKGDPLVLLAYTQRRKDLSAKEEGTFFAMLKAAGMKAHLIPFSRIPYGDSEEFLLTSLYELRWM